MTLRIEVFPDDLDAFVKFYTEVLGFTLTVDQRGTGYPYAAVEHGRVRIGAARAWEQVDSKARTPPAGVEIVLEVDDVTAFRDRVQATGFRDRVQATGYPLEQDLQSRPWGLTDFRLHDPAGYYLRITNKGLVTRRRLAGLGS
jgi:predicted enzyme related to lactoylglutathione lyase